MNNSRPLLDKTTQDWSAIQGEEKDGWTAVQLRRSLDTCDPMDFPIKVRHHSPNAVRVIGISVWYEYYYICLWSR